MRRLNGLGGSEGADFRSFSMTGRDRAKLRQVGNADGKDLDEVQERPGARWRTEAS